MVERILFVAAFVALPAVARANVPAPDSVGAKVTGNTVEICGSQQHCDRPMLRQGPGGVVVVPQNCDERCAVDECVPPGSYRYGPQMAAFGDCHPSVAATVTAPLAPDCKPSAGAPSPFAGEPPWVGDDLTDSCSAPGYCGRCATGVPRDDPAGAAAAILAGIFVSALIGWRRRRR